MERLPNDPAMLVSAINMFLRDEEFDSLDALCFCYDSDPAKLKAYLHDNGYYFNEEQKQFKAIIKGQ